MHPRRLHSREGLLRAKLVRVADGREQVTALERVVRPCLRAAVGVPRQLARPARLALRRFRNRELDDQERIALGSFDRDVRRRAYWRIQAILVDQVPEITTWFWRRIDVVNDDLRNYRPAHAVTTFWNTWQYEI